MSEDFKRRDVFRLGAGGLLVVKLGKADAPAFFTQPQLASVEALMETIIPADAHSPGAKAAGCAEYVNRQLGETIDEEEKSAWRNGLEELEKVCQHRHGKSIAAITEQQRVALLTEISKNEVNPHTPQEKFFGRLKNATAFAYYTSKTGIHQEMEYKGNVYLKEFQGTELTEPAAKLIQRSE